MRRLHATSRASDATGEEATGDEDAAARRVGREHAAAAREIWDDEHVAKILEPGEYFYRCRLGVARARERVGGEFE